MPMWMTLIFQLLATAGQVANAVTPSEYKYYVAAALSIVQTVQACVAHYYNPDGTTARVAFEPKK